jgi:hypothetical protein
MSLSVVFHAYFSNNIRFPDLFSDVKDFLEIFGVYKLPLGVTIDTERHTAYNITKIANLYSPLKSFNSYVTNDTVNLCIC